MASIMVLFSGLFEMRRAHTIVFEPLSEGASGRRSW